jgi:hypothetical protein
MRTREDSQKFLKQRSSTKLLKQITFNFKITVDVVSLLHTASASRLSPDMWTPTSHASGAPLHVRHMLSSVTTVHALGLWVSISMRGRIRLPDLTLDH